MTFSLPLPSLLPKLPIKSCFADCFRCPSKMIYIKNLVFDRISNVIVHGKKAYTTTTKKKRRNPKKSILSLFLYVHKAVKRKKEHVSYQQGPKKRFFFSRSYLHQIIVPCR